MRAAKRFSLAVGFLRKNHPLFRMNNAEQIRKLVNFCTQYQLGVVSYCIQGKEVGDSWDKVIVVFNAKNEVVSIPLPEGKFQVVAKGDEINESGTGEIVSDEIKVEGISMMIVATMK